MGRGLRSGRRTEGDDGWAPVGRPSASRLRGAAAGAASSAVLLVGALACATSDTQSQPPDDSIAAGSDFESAATFAASGEPSTSAADDPASDVEQSTRLASDVEQSTDPVDAVEPGDAAESDLAVGAGESGAATVSEVPADLDDSGEDASASRNSHSSFSTAVQPILEHRCASCHTAGGPGSATLTLSTAADAAAIADDLALVTRVGYMPPWRPSDLSPEFVNDWSLSDEEIAAIAAWAAAGGGLDVAPSTPLVPRAQAVRPIEEDLVIGPRDGPYRGYAAPDGTPLKRDDYRCQVHEVADPQGDGTWIKGFEFRPDERSVVHHAIVYRAPAGAAAAIERRIEAEDATEAADGLADEPGWTCFALTGLDREEVYAIQGWAPGQSPTVYPAGYGLYLAPGDLIVNQVHYHYSHETRPDASQIILDTATESEVATGMAHIAGSVYLTPAEIPCTPQEAAVTRQRAATVDGYVDMCIRSHALADISRKYGHRARWIPDLLIAQCGGSVDDYDDLDGSISHSSCDMPARDTGTIHTVLAHMHEIGAAYRMTLHPDTSAERILLDIPVWDFEWQLNYEPVEDIRIEAGDIVRFECWWDRTLRHMPEPRYVTWNEGTGDEMCYSSISVIPD